MGKSRFIELMAKSLDKSATAEELKELEVFLQESARNKKIEQIANSLEIDYEQSGSPLQETEINNKLKELWGKIRHIEAVDLETPEYDISRGNGKIIALKWISAAAAVLIFAVGGWLFFKSKQHDDSQLTAAVIRNVNVPYGKTLKLKLPDGTLVKLNAGSHFSYPSFFSNTQRDVKLDGEGFFEVTKNPKKPFLVHTLGLTVRVLGTVFNVKAYSNDNKTETTLLKGKVQVELANDPEKKIILSPHEKLTVNNQEAVITNKTNNAGAVKIKYEVAALPITINDVYPENAWIDDKIMFANSDFEDVARQMERKYNVQIVFEDEALKKEQISGVLENESLDTALDFLKQIVALQTKTEGNTVYLYHKAKNK